MDYVLDGENGIDTAHVTLKLPASLNPLMV